MLGPEHDEQYERGSVISIETRLVALTTFLKVSSFSNRLQDAKDLLAETLVQEAICNSPARSAPTGLFTRCGNCSARG